MANVWWQKWAAKFPPKDCDYIIEKARQLEPRRGLVGGHAGGSPSVEHDMRRSTIRWIMREPEWDWLWRRVEDLFRETNSIAWAFAIEHIKSLQFTEYHEDQQGHYDWHEDLDWKSPNAMQRKLSMVVQLSRPDEYEGGVLELAHDNPTDPNEFKGRGSAILFPSYLRHRVTPVTRGRRYSLVTWMEGPNFR